MLCSVGFIIVRRVRLIIGPSKQLTFWLPEFSTKTNGLSKYPTGLSKKNISKNRQDFRHFKKGSVLKKRLSQVTISNWLPKKPSVGAGKPGIPHGEPWLGTPKRRGESDRGKTWEIRTEAGKVEGCATPQERFNNKGGAGSTFFEILKRDLTGDNILGWIRITTTLPVQRSKHSAIGNILPLKQGSWNIRLRGEQAISKCMVFFRDFSWKVRCLGW